MIYRERFAWQQSLNKSKEGTCNDPCINFPRSLMKHAEVTLHASFAMRKDSESAPRGMVLFLFLKDHVTSRKKSRCAGGHSYRYIYVELGSRYLRTRCDVMIPPPHPICRWLPTRWDGLRLRSNECLLPMSFILELGVEILKCKGVMPSAG